MLLVNTKVVNAGELVDDGEYEEILEDMRDEGGKFGIYILSPFYKLSVYVLPCNYAVGVFCI